MHRLHAPLDAPREALPNHSEDEQFLRVEWNVHFKGGREERGQCGWRGTNRHQVEAAHRSHNT